ncbi:MAG: TetR/AcrR family transcriptional regulator [Reyranella sp.]|jgi:AcrR family transcriptional regulator|nr:TetR/AcrR family transcriptional regulator [Reyranella sp.]
MARRISGRGAISSRPSALTAGSSTDGRHRRSEDTRRRLFEAMLALMGEMGDIPTISQIADRAGVGLRTLYQHFPEATALYAATFDHVITTTLATMPPVSPEGPLSDRIAGFVERRSRVCETWAPMWRVALRFAVNNEGFRERVERVNQLLRARAQILYSVELAALPPATQALALDALMSLTEMDAWEHLRLQCRRDVDEARAVWRFSIAALFAALAAKD